jgi:hypothetical protein
VQIEMVVEVGERHDLAAVGLRAQDTVFIV